MMVAHDPRLPCAERRLAAPGRPGWARTAALVLCGLAACGAAGGSHGDSPGATSLAGAAAPSSALEPVAALRLRAPCKRRGQAGALAWTTTDGAGRVRRYELLVPAAAQAGAPLAVTFVFHGAGGTPGDAREMGLQAAPGAAASSIFVFPQGVRFQSHGVGWDDRCGGDDMVFFDRMLATIEAAYCVAPERIYVAGFSWGCDFVTALACCRGDRIRGVIAASCSDEFADPADPATYANAPCPTRSAARIRFTHDRKGDGSYTAQQFEATGALFRALGGCSRAGTVGPPPCIAYGGCRQPTVECAYADLGHALPPAWAAESWRFLTAP